MIRVTVYSKSNSPLGDTSRVDWLPGKFRDVVNHQRILNSAQTLHVKHWRSKHSSVYDYPCRAHEIASICKEVGLKVVVEYE